MCNPDLDGGGRDQTSSGTISGGLVSIDDNPAASLIGLLPFGDAIAKLVADLEDLDSSIASSPAAQRAGSLSLDFTRRKAPIFIRWARPSVWCSSCSARPALACRSAGAVNPLSAPAPQLRDLLLRRRRCRPVPCPHASLPRPSSAASSHTSAARPAAEPSFCGLSEGRPLVPTRSCCVMQSSLPHKAPASLRTRACSIPHSTCPSPSARALLYLPRR